MTFSNGSIKLDNLSGSGDFSLAMRETKPLLTGELALGALDLRPYMAAWSDQNATGAIMPWSTDPIALNGLDSIDAEFGITTPSITMDRIEIGDTAGDITLKNGVLTADLERMKLYGGDAAGKFAIKNTGGVPTLTVDTTLKSVTAQNFFAASGGFDKVTGTSDFAVSFTGTGRSQDAIMKSLNGGGTFAIRNGQILGLDVGSLVSGVDQALTSRTLPASTGLGGTTAFKDIDSKFSLSNGRATLSGFQLESGSFFMDADGYIDLGQQQIDIGIRPKVTGGSQIADFGVPLRFKGKFGQATPGLDSAFLTNIATAKARSKASSLVQEQLGDSAVGNIVGGLIGGNNAGTADGTSTAAPSAGSILGGLLGGNTPTTTPNSQVQLRVPFQRNNSPHPKPPHPKKKSGMR